MVEEELNRGQEYGSSGARERESTSIGQGPTGTSREEESFGRGMGTPTGVGSTQSRFGSMESGHERPMGVREAFRSGTPDDVRRAVADKVAKGMGAVAGALRGFTEQSERDNLASRTQQAIQKAGETTREVARTAKEEVQRVRQPAHSETTSGTLGPEPSGPQGQPTWGSESQF